MILVPSSEQVGSESLVPGRGTPTHRRVNGPKANSLIDDRLRSCPAFPVAQDRTWQHDVCLPRAFDYVSRR